MFEAWHLPGLPTPTEWLEGRTHAGSAFRAPSLSGTEAGIVAAYVREGALEARAHRATTDVIQAIGAAAARLTAEGSAGIATRELLHAEIGWDDRLIRDTLDGMARTWTTDALAGLVDSELGGPAVLDGFVRDEGWDGPGVRRRRAVGAPVVLQVLATFPV